MFGCSTRTDVSPPESTPRSRLLRPVTCAPEPATPGATVARVTTSLKDQLALQLAPERQQLVDYVFPGKTTKSVAL